MADSVPALPDEVTPEWLTLALRNAGAITTAHVTACQTTIIGQDWGFTGIVARVDLQYDQPEPHAPASVVAKFPNAAGETLSAFRTNQQSDPELARRYLQRCAREILFYQQVAPRSPLAAPRMYYGVADLDGGRFVLLLEDLRGMRFGDAVLGCSVNQTAAVLDAIAPFHAAWWGRSGDEQLAWIPQWPEDAQWRADRFQQHAGSFLERFGERVPQAVQEALRMLDSGFLLAMHELSRAPKTIAHSDLHLDNVAFDTDGSAAIIDWQGVRWMPAAYDVAGFVSGSPDPQSRRESEHEILQRYHRLLVQHGVTDYAYGDLLHHYRIALACILGNIVIWLGSADLSGATGRELELRNGMLNNDRLFSLVVDHRLNELY